MAYGPRNLTHFGRFFLVQHFFQRLRRRQLLTWAARLEQQSLRTKRIDKAGQGRADCPEGARYENRGFLPSVSRPLQYFPLTL